MNNIETIKLALEALESCGWNDGYAGKTQYFHDELVDKAIATLRQAIEQAQQAEPVLWAGVDFDIKTSPPQRQWVGLTDEEIGALLGPFPKYASWWGYGDFYQFARAIEAAHGIRENK